MRKHIKYDAWNTENTEPEVRQNFGYQWKRRMPQREIRVKIKHPRKRGNLKKELKIVGISVIPLLVLAIIFLSSGFAGQTQMSAYGVDDQTEVIQPTEAFVEEDNSATIEVAEPTTVTLGIKNYFVDTEGELVPIFAEQDEVVPVRGWITLPVVDGILMYTDELRQMLADFKTEDDARYQATLVEEVYEPLWVDIDLTAQWLYAKRGNEIVFQTGVITGKPSTPTPTGEFKVQKMEKGRYLTGKDYKVWVDYWVPFNGGYGMHDASWQKEKRFGTDAYKNGHGSHGCVNISPEVMGEFYDLLYAEYSQGTEIKVVVHN